ncbi:hypothetical protein MTO96_046730 [Rhipicephalus appendiculatus]
MGATRPAPGLSPMAVSGLHGGGGRRGSPGCPAAYTGRHGRVLQEPLLWQYARGADKDGHGQGCHHEEGFAGAVPARPALGRGPRSPLPTPHGGGPPLCGAVVGAAGSTTPTSDKFPEDGMATMDVERLLEH